MHLSVKGLLFLFSVAFCLTGCGQNVDNILRVFQQYQAAVAEEDTQAFLNAIDSGSREYLLTQLELLKENNRQSTQDYINQRKYPVVNVDMIARALNYYKPAQIDTLSPSGYLNFNLGYLIQLEETAIEGFTFREKLLQTDRRAILKFSKPLDEERNTVADFEFLKEGDQWKLNLTDRLNLLENNARITLKYADQNVWDYVSEKLDNYYPE